VIYCGNEDHPKRPAVAKLSWPDGRFISVPACATCMRWSVSNALHDVGERRPILITPLILDDAP
jgi:hypothetical protein